MRSKDAPLEGVTHSFMLHRHDLSERTQEWYSYNLRYFREWCEATLNREAVVGDVEPGTVNAYLSHRNKTGSEHVARAAWVSLRALATFMAEQGIHHENGESALRKVRQPRCKEDGRRALNDSEMWKLIEAAGKTENGARDRAIVVTLLGAGLRVGELTGLRLKDLDFRERTISVRASTSKSRHTRTVTMVHEVAKELDRYLADYRKGPDDSDAPVFTNRDGRPMSRVSVGLVFRRLKLRTGIRDLCAHMCRHTWATNFRRAGSGDIFDLQVEGGWSDLRMVRRYSKTRPLEERRRAPSPFAAARRSYADRESPPQAGALSLIRSA
ncbi:MAG: hypothetical protein FJ028_04250 [Chloroflexi bacterium]|nr:hypothetical protein [Chloroflexota bacterium]